MPRAPRVAKHGDRRTKRSRITRESLARNGDLRDRGSRNQREALVPAKIDDNRIGFFDLPLELRTIVYEHALKVGDGHTIPLNLGAHLRVANELAFGLLGTCRMTRKETTSILYGQNTFRIDIVPALDAIPPSTAQIRQERVESENDHRRYTATDLKNWWMEEVATPQLSRALRLISPAQLGSVRSFLFVYHAKRLKPTELYSTYDFSRTPELTLKLQFSKQQPPCTIALDRLEDFKTIFSTRGTAISIMSYMTDCIESRSLRALSRRNVRAFSLWISDKCEGDLRRHPELDV